MRFSRRVVLASLTVALHAATPGVAAAKDKAHTIHGTRTATTTINALTGAATAVSSGKLSHVGTFTGDSTLQFIPTSATTFIATGPATVVAKNGDELFGTLSATGVTDGAVSTSTDTITITGGTGRFEGASGTLTETITSVLVSSTATSQVFHDTATISGTLVR